MLLVEEGVESGMEGFDLSLRRAAEKSMTLGEFDGVMQHVQLRKRVLRGFLTPVLMDITHHSTPSLDIGSTPVIRAKQAMMELLQPAGEDRVRGGKMDELCRRWNRSRLDGLQRDADLVEELFHCSSRVLASLPPLRWAKTVVGSLRMVGWSEKSPAVRMACSSSAMRTVVLHFVQSGVTKHAKAVAKSSSLSASPLAPPRGTCTQRCATQRSIDERYLQPEQT